MNYKLLKTILLACTFFIIMISNSFTEEVKKPSVISKQYNDWLLRCVEIKKKQECEIIQTLQVNNSNLKFTIIYTKFTNQEKKLKEMINIITPLGVNLQKKISLIFHKGSKIDLLYTKCEVMGCIVSLSNNTKEKKIINQFNLIKTEMQKSEYFDIAINSFSQKPILIKSSLRGFKNALKEFNNSIS